MSFCDCASGLPTSRDSMRARRSASTVMSCDSRIMSRPRSTGASAPHSPSKAARAAFTALSISCGPPRAISAKISPVAGSMTGRVRPSAERTHSFAMKWHASVCAVRGRSPAWFMATHYATLDEELPDLAAGLEPGDLESGGLLGRALAPFSGRRHITLPGRHVGKAAAGHGDLAARAQLAGNLQRIQVGRAGVLHLPGHERLAPELAEHPDDRGRAAGGLGEADGGPQEGTRPLAVAAHVERA